MNVTCPCCNTKFELSVEVRSRVRDSKEVFIKRAWVQFLFWCLVGRPKYQEDQWWYDSYHSHVKFEPGEKPGDGTAYFSIQIHDSPEGDLWLHAKVPVKAGNLTLSEAEYQYSGACFYNWSSGKKECREE